MTVSTLLSSPAATPAPSDADLLMTTASLLAACPGRTLGPRLSQLLHLVCSVYAGDDAADRTARLEWELADYLHAWRVLRWSEDNPAALDVWAAAAPLPFVRISLLACARHQRSFGGGC